MNKELLSKPHNGWTEFLLGEHPYSLCYLTQIPTDWLDHAIHGLETLTPFAVHGFCEPGRFLCTVSYWNCHVIFECDDNIALSPADHQHSTIHMDMLQFCRMLHNTISNNLEAWSDWNPHGGLIEKELQKKRKVVRKELENRLRKLNGLIQKREEYFGEHCCFC